MNMRRPIFFLILMSLLLISCGGESRLAEVNENEIKKSINRSFRDLQEAAKSLDVDRYTSFIAREKFTFLNEDGTVFHSFDDFKKLYSEGIASVERYDSLEFDRVKITVIDQSNAVLVNEFKAVLKLKSGEVLPTGGAGTQVWSKIKGDWKLVNISSSSKPRKNAS
ncbi:MAG: nuclear transport factor 2 family protein [Pyrinomonadaceae bacterium]|nr:nuclear transport factor 2 family protein [Pyrinomonadaceae bacterium]